MAKRTVEQLKKVYQELCTTATNGSTEGVKKELWKVANDCAEDLDLCVIYEDDEVWEEDVQIMIRRWTDVDGALGVFEGDSDE